MTQLSFDAPLTVEETAAALNIGRSTVFELLKEGSIRSVKIRSATRILSSEVERFYSTLKAGTYQPLGPKQGVR
jgi:excisionase family DNA binding protein